ncbi:hypothetical protein ElyMa_002061900 [Elysia marginata]|uniref:Uncharacterized protein n=1 Tax=Elysia marginata TaxID=1093978 RepID=A0AAV4FB29_9GAST|nr:hypothetical protein ElyMa_002061900 [Elysia marginata]
MTLATDLLPGGTSEDYAEHLVQTIDSIVKVHAEMFGKEGLQFMSSVVQTFHCTMRDRASVNHCTAVRLMTRLNVQRWKGRSNGFQGIPEVPGNTQQFASALRRKPPTIVFHLGDSIFYLKDQLLTYLKSQCSQQKLRLAFDLSTAVSRILPHKRYATKWGPGHVMICTITMAHKAFIMQLHKTEEGQCHRCKDRIRPFITVCFDQIFEPVKWLHWERRADADKKLDVYGYEELSGQVLMLQDFAENRKAIYAGKVKSAHFSKAQIALHPFVCFYGNAEGQLVRHVAMIFSMTLATTFTLSTTSPS